MTLIRHTDTRRTETPGGVMTTLASPTQGDTGQALWQVRVRPGVAARCTPSTPNRSGPYWPDS